MVDLGALDIVRERERKVPRLNDFRRIFNLPPYLTIDHLAGHDPEICQKLKDIYGCIEKVDTTVGVLVEKKSEGFIIPQTIYSLFIHQTIRRIECDRFLTKCFNEKYYTKFGLEYVKTTSFASVLNRHYPELTPKEPNTFFHWTN